MKVRIEGHTDGLGEPKVLQELSEKRAEAIRDYLIGKGIEASRLKTKGLGASQPIAPNNMEENRRANRRVELRVLGL